MKKKIFNIIKLIFTFIFITYSLVVAYGLFFSSSMHRFKLAEGTQGFFLSQTIFDVLIFQEPNFSDAYFEKSVAYNKRGLYTDGFEMLNKAVDLNAKKHLGYRGWLRLVKLKDYEGSVKDLERLDSLTPNYVDAAWGENIHFLKGICHLGLDNFDAAIKEFDHYIKSEKDSSWVNANAFLYKGIAFSELNKNKEATENFVASLEQNPKSSDAFFHYGVYLKKIKMTDSSKIILTNSKELINNGFKNKDIYNEAFYEIYLSDIEEELN